MLTRRGVDLAPVQVLMFSATFPDALRAEVKRFLHENYIFLQIGSASNANRFNPLPSLSPPFPWEEALSPASGTLSKSSSA